MWGVEFLANYTVKQIQAQTLLMNHEVALNVQIVHHRFVTSNECPWWNHQVTHLMDSALQKFNSFRAFHWRKLKQDCSPGLFRKFSCPIIFALFWCCMQHRWFDHAILIWIFAPKINIISCKSSMRRLRKLNLKSEECKQYFLHCFG